MRPRVLVPRRRDGGHRDRLWDYCERWWDTSGLGWPVSVGYDEGPGPFNFSAAVNRAAALPGDWDVGVLSIGDAFPGDPSQPLAAAAIAAETGRFTLAHDRLESLSQEGTERVLAGEAPSSDLTEWPAWPNTFSTLFAFPRSLFVEVGGFDERFAGWGWEDFGFWSACWAFAGGFERIPDGGPVWHFWHERSFADRDGNPGYAANEELGKRYMAVRTSREETEKILREPGGPLA